MRSETVLTPLHGAGRRRSCLLAAGLCWLALGAQPAAAQPTGQLAVATLTQCSHAEEQSERAATFAAEATATAATARMAVRVEVQQRLGGEAPFRTVKAPGLGSWRSSQAGVKVYKYLAQVTNLQAPGEFRALIGFRWFTASGRLIRQSQRHTPICQQPDSRPRLTVGPVSASPIGESANAEYQITVNNSGRSPASAFAVLLSASGTTAPPLQLPQLAPGASTVVAVSAPRCQAGSEIEVSLDPSRHVPKAPGGRLARRLACPLAGASS